MPIVAVAADAVAGDLTNLGTVFSQIGNWITDILAQVTNAPILLIGLGLMVTSSIIGLAYKLIRGN